MSSDRTSLLSPGSVPEEQLTYVVIGAMLGDLWIFVRHHRRTTWEMPAGHIEQGETADQAAVRELYEETGAVESHLVHVCDYRVDHEDYSGYGRLYSAQVAQREDTLEHEIAEIRLFSELPGELTYPEVQTILFERVKQQLRS